MSAYDDVIDWPLFLHPEIARDELACGFYELLKSKREAAVCIDVSDIAIVVDEIFNFSKSARDVIGKITQGVRPPFKLAYLHMSKGFGAYVFDVAIAGKLFCAFGYVAAKDGVIALIGVQGYEYDKNGNLLNMRFGQRISAISDRAWLQALGVVSYSFAFMNCRNVELVEHKVDERLQQSRIRKGKKPLVTHYVLSIKELRKVAERENTKNDKAKGWIKALHLCRGSFAEYKEDKPLFGKVVGRVWRPSHIKGKKENGEVVKDYKLKTTTSSG